MQTSFLVAYVTAVVKKVFKDAENRKMTYERAIDLLTYIIDNGVGRECFRVSLAKDDVEAIEFAIEAMEKQVAKKVEYVGSWAVCPSCECVYDCDSTEWEKDFCWSCGQKIDWSEE